MRRFAIAGFLLAWLPGAAAAADIAWDSIPGKEITLFYPGQMSWELLLTQEEHSGAKEFRAGKNCQGCHGGDEKASGAAMVRDKKAEPYPIAGKPGFIPLTVKAVARGGALTVRLEIAPGNQPDAGMDKDHPLKAAIMFGGAEVAEGLRAGCWGACHDDLTGMPGHQGAAAVTKYLARSRTSMSRNGGGPVKTADELAAIKAAGGFMELWQARVTPEGTGDVVAGPVLAERLVDGPKPAVTVSATGGMTVITFSRALDAGPGARAFQPGQAYPVGFSVHAGGTAGRFHYVSLEHMFRIGPEGDVSVTAQ